MAEQHLIGAGQLRDAFRALAQDQVPFAISLGLTQVAKQAKQDVERSLPNRIDRPTPFTQRSVGAQTASKRRLQSRVFIKDRQASYLGMLEKGGTLTPKRKALVVPAGVRLNKYGNLTKNRVKILLARKDVFSGTVGGTGGIWQRRKRKGPKLLLAYQSQRQVRPQLRFRETVVESVKRNASERMVNAISFAMRTRKPR